MRIKLEKNEQLSCDLHEKLYRGLTGWFTRGVAWELHRELGGKLSGKLDDKLSVKLFDNFIGSYED